jgi:hypothetical protein
MAQAIRTGEKVSASGELGYHMSEVPGAPGTYQDIAIDYETPIKALLEAGYAGYINSEYEGQRFFQDGTRADLMSEIDQVRRHQEMLRRLIGASPWRLDNCPKSAAASDSLARG